MYKAVTGNIKLDYGLCVAVCLNLGKLERPPEAGAPVPVLDKDGRKGGKDSPWNLNRRVGKPGYGFLGVVSVQRAINAVARMHCFEKDLCFCFPANLAHYYPVWPHSKGVYHEIKHADFALAFRIWKAGCKRHPVKRVWKGKLTGIFY